MASLYKNKERKTWIIDVHEVGKIRAGSNKSVASAIKERVEALVEARKLGVPPDSSTALWVEGLQPGYLRDRLSTLGLISVDSVSHTVGELLEVFTNRAPEKQNSREFYRQVTESLERFLGSEKLVEEVTEGDALAFRRWLLENGRLVPHPTKGTKLAEATIARRIVGARQVFKLAIRLGWAPLRRSGNYDIPFNPFEDVKTGRQFNPDKVRFISIEDAERIIDKLPSPEMRLAFGLVRYAGMRCPSELSLLRSSDVDLKAREMTFRAPKTEGYVGKEIRSCPIFQEEETGVDLLRLFGDVDLSAEMVLPTFSAWNTPGQSFTKVVRSAIKAAGLEVWPKLFVNCRGSRATEVWRLYGPANETDWLGHSEGTARKHYLRQMPGDWKRATGKAR